MIRRMIQEPARIAFAVTMTIVVAYMIDAGLEAAMWGAIFFISMVALIELYEWWTGNEVFPFSRRST